MDMNMNTNNSKNKTKTKVKNISKNTAPDTSTQTHSTEKSTFVDTTTPTTQQEQTTFGDVIDLLSVSPSAGDQPTTTSDRLRDFIIMALKYGFLVIILALNFLGLSASLNCNADQELTKRIFSAIFAFFFGFVYLLINYYTYKVMYQGKICKFNKDKLFPFRA
jgi:hypothetical protein